jgi:hypothetical protein
MSSERVLDRIPHSSSSTNKAIIQVANEQRIDNLGRAGFYRSDREFDNLQLMQFSVRTFSRDIYS